MRRFFLFLVALSCVMGAWSEDARTVVNRIEFPNFHPEIYLVSGMTMGDDVRKVLIEQLQPEPGAPYYAQETGILPALYECVDAVNDKYKKVNDGDILRVASYYCETQVRIDGANGALYRFPDKPGDMLLTINGLRSYDPLGELTFYGGYINEEASVRWFRTDIFNLSSRKVISIASFTDFQPTAYIEPGMKMGDEVRAILGAQFHPAEDAPYYAQVSGSLPTLYRWNSGTSTYDQLHDGDEITIGTYRCGTQVRLDGVPGITKCFPAKAEDLRVFIDKEECVVYGGYVDDKASVRWIYTPDFDVRSRKCGADLTWTYNGAKKRLEIDGTGAMYTFTYDESIKRYRTPWYDIAGIEKVKLPAELTTIGRGAFYLLEELAEITIPDGVTSIGNKAFYGTALKTITIPNSVTTIGDEAFYYCDNLKSVVLPDAITEIGVSVFAQCINLVSIELPATVKKLGDYAFSSCFGLKSITSLATTPPTCGENAFQSVNKSIPVYVPKASIAAYKAKEGWKDFEHFYVKGEPCGENLIWSFDEVTGTLSFVLTGAVTGTMTNYVSTYEVPWYSVRNSVKTVELPDGLTNIGATAFAFCSDLKSVTIPSSVKTIGRSAFRASGLKSVTIPDNVTSCEPYAFATCASLTSVTLGSGITTITEKMFADCTGLKEFTIPATVTGIDLNAFIGCTGLLTVNFADGIKSIGTSAFSGCTNLVSATLPFSLNTIGDNAFYDCVSLEEMNMPTGVTSIGTSAFSGCVGLKSISIPTSVTTIPESAFSGCSSLESLTLHSGITNIGVQSFKDCTGLTDIVVKAATPPTCEPDAFDGVDKEIPVYVPVLSLSTYEDADVWKDFSHLQSEPFICGKNLKADFGKGTLTITGDGDMFNFEWDKEKKISSAPWMEIRNSINKVVLPEGLTSIGTFAFANMPNLTSISLPDNVASIGKGAFRDCPLSAATFGSELAAIGDSAFYACDALTSIDLTSVTSLGTGVFQGCTSLTEVTLNEELTAIPDYLFAQCGIEEITLPDGLLSIGEGAFYSCSSLLEIAIPSGVTFLGPDAFAECSSLTSINIPDGVTTLEEGLFYLCTGLPFVEIPAGVTSIGEGAFSNCISLSTIEIPSGVTSIGSGAFAGCESFTSIVIPEGVTVIEPFTFNGCIGLTDVTIPKGVTEIGEMAFSYCEMLPEINIPEGVEMFGDRAFFGCTSLESIEIPLGSITIGERAFMDCQGLKNVTISNSVKSIEKLAFWGCTGLQGISIGSGVKNIEYAAFNDCSALTSITCKAEVPPTCYEMLFKDVDKSIPLYVPAASVSDYTLAEEWKLFSNIRAIQKCGDDLTWTFDEPTKTLTIFGTGDMYDFDWSEEHKVPWYDLRASIENIELSEHLTGIGNNAFCGCNIKNINFPKRLERIGEAVFSGCKKLEAITLPNVITTIGASLFMECTALKNMVLPESVTSIDASAFSNCTGLESVTFPKGLVTIDEWAFYDCPALKSLDLPASVTTIGKSAFAECSGLTAITTLSLTPPACGEKVFDEVDKSIPVFVHRKAMKAYRLADGWKDFSSFKSLEGPMSVLGHEITPDMYGKKLSIEGVGGDVYVTKNGIYLYNATINASEATEPAIEVHGEEGADEFVISGVNSQITAGKNCPAAILADGKATVNINTNWTNLVEHKGNLTFDIYSESDKGAIIIPEDADIKLNLNTQASYSYDTLTIISAYSGINTLYGGVCDIHASGNVRIFSADYSCPIGYNNRTLTLNNTTMVLPYGGSVTEAGLFDAAGEDAFALQLRTSLPIHQSGKAYPIELGGVTVSEGNAKDILGDGKASYNAETNTLTLDGIDLDAEYAQALRVVKSSLTVEVKGSNSISSGSSYPVIEVEAGNLVFAGAKDALLTVIGETGVSGDQTEKYGVVVNRCQVDISAIGTHNQYALQADSLTIDAGTLHLTTTSDEVDAVAWLSNNGSKSGGLVLKHAIVQKGVVNVDKEMLFEPVAEYKVTFQDKDGNLIAEVYVFEGEAAKAPDAPEVEGYHFTGWDPADLSSVTEDLIVKATYAINTYTVKFYDHSDNVISTQTVNWNEAALEPELAAWDGHTFTSWSVEFDHVKSDLDIKPIYDVETYKVTFVGFDGETSLKVENVQYGQGATAPEAPAVEGYTFTGWDKAFDNITGNLTVKAVYERNYYKLKLVAEHGYIAITDESGEHSLNPDMIEHGQKVRLIATADDGYVLKEWSTGETEDIIFVTVTSDKTVTATFVLKSDEPTGIDNVEQPSLVGQKVLRDGKLFIIVGDKTFDATGRLVK